MLEKLSERISKINEISKYILKYGLLACLILFIFISYKFNIASTLEDVLIAEKIAGSGFYMLMEVVVGAILFDVCMNNK